MEVKIWGIADLSVGWNKHLLSDSAKFHAVNGFIIPYSLFEACSDLSIVKLEGATIWEAFELARIAKWLRKHRIEIRKKGNLGEY